MQYVKPWLAMSRVIGNTDTSMSTTRIGIGNEAFHFEGESIEFLRGRSAGDSLKNTLKMGCSFPSLSYCASTAPSPLFEASAYSKKVL
jgi:hypothetical protein